MVCCATTCLFALAFVRLALVYCMYVLQPICILFFQEAQTQFVQFNSPLDPLTPVSSPRSHLYPISSSHCAHARAHADAHDAVASAI